MHSYSRTLPASKVILSRCGSMHVQHLYDTQVKLHTSNKNGLLCCIHLVWAFNKQRCKSYVAGGLFCRYS